MPRYDFGCEACEIRWEIVKRMSEISSHIEPCPECSKPSTQIFDDVSGMIRVREGASPTRFGDGSYKATQTARDDGFKKEFESIWEGSGAPEHPGTGERMELHDDEGGSGQYMAFPSTKAADRAALEAAERRGMDGAKQRERNREQYLENQLKAANERVRKWNPKRKGGKS